MIIPIDVRNVIRPLTMKMIFWNIKIMQNLEEKVLAGNSKDKSFLH